MFYKSIASEGKLVFRRAWDARASSQSGRLDLLGRPMPKLDEDEEPGFQESVIPSVGKRTAREAHRRYRQRRRRFDPLRTLQTPARLFGQAGSFNNDLPSSRSSAEGKLSFDCK
jgi:hypothetical protein